MATATADIFRIYTPDELGRDDYPVAWYRIPGSDKGIKDLVREAADNRCVRCSHPYLKGANPLEEDPETGRLVSWSPCDEHCFLNDRHPFGDPHTRTRYEMRATLEGEEAVEICEARWRILTVHHLNGAKHDCRWWNLASLCQRCHLTIQGKVYLSRPWTSEHSAWFKPYAAGWYAFHYLGEDLTRDETEARLEELLDLERWPTLFDEAIR